MSHPSPPRRPSLPRRLHQQLGPLAFAGLCIATFAAAASALAWILVGLTALFGGTGAGFLAAFAIITIAVAIATGD